MCAEQQGTSSCCLAKESAFYNLLQEHGQYHCLEVQREEEVFDFTKQKSKAPGKVNATYEQFIVRFQDYRFSGEHKKRLQSAVSEDRGLIWIDRRNEASKYTTDFGVFKLPNDAKQEATLQIINSLKKVRDVFIDKVVREPQEYKSSGYPDIPFERKERVSGPKSNFTLHQINSLYQPEKLWQEGFTGQGIRVGIFDTGIGANEDRVRNIKWRSNWTFQPTRSDGHGHGTSMAGSVASIDPECPGTAPDVDLYTFKVFTDDSVSFTSWYLDAINFVHVLRLNMVNISIGGPDWHDWPFVDKFKQLIANGVIVFTSNGNQGPQMGTTNSPADDMWLIAVGSHNGMFDVSNYQSRGMSLQELPRGYGRVKPDILAYADPVLTLGIKGKGCTKVSGTSSASPVTLGIAALLASTIPEEERYRKLNPASIRQVLIEGADRLADAPIYVQGPGAVNLLQSYEVMKKYEPRVSTLPDHFDLVSDPDKTYLWPHTSQPLYARAMPLIANFTILNGLGSVGYFTDAPRWNPSNRLGGKIRLQFDYNTVLWPWAGYLGVYMHVEDSAAHMSGVAAGSITFNISSPPFPGEKYKHKREQRVTIPVKVEVIPTPPRSKRVLWDNYHNVGFPFAFIPKDSTYNRHAGSGSTYDYEGDHPHTNYHKLFDELVDSGYYVEVLSSSFTCFDASEYGSLVLVDSEGEFDQEEIDKLHDDVTEDGLGLIVLADWWSQREMEDLTIFDPNKRDFITPLTGGANVPSLNRLLSNFDIAFSNRTTQGLVMLKDRELPVYLGTAIARMPSRSVILKLERKSGKQDRGIGSAALGLTKVGEGNILVFVDSTSFEYDVYNAIEKSMSSKKLGVHKSPKYDKNMLGVFAEFVKYASEAEPPEWIESGSYFEDGYEDTFNTADDIRAGITIPSEHEGLVPEEEMGVRTRESRGVLHKPLQCFRNAPLNYQPDRSALTKKRNNNLMKWMSWAGERMHLIEGSSSTPPNNIDAGYLKYLQHNSEDRDFALKQDRTTRTTGGNGSYLGQAAFFLLAFVLGALLFSRKGKLRRHLTPKGRYSRLKQSV